MQWQPALRGPQMLGRTWRLVELLLSQFPGRPGYRARPSENDILRQLSGWAPHPQAIPTCLLRRGCRC